MQQGRFRLVQDILMLLIAGEEPLVFIRIDGVDLLAVGENPLSGALSTVHHGCFPSGRGYYTTRHRRMRY